MKAHAVKPNVDADALLPGAQFIDAYSIAVNDVTLDARRATKKMMARGPRWVEALLNLRNRLVAPFGLKTPVPTGTSATDTIGRFPVISETPDRLVVGFNDKHLDFRVVVDVVSEAGERRVTATTLVLTHNLLGRVYLAIILPFHRIIARTMMQQVADYGDAKRRAS
jgi:hypothetical protein